jgi:hypothetical protein
LVYDHRIGRHRQNWRVHGTLRLFLEKIFGIQRELACPLQTVADQTGGVTSERVRDAALDKRGRDDNEVVERAVR